MSELYGQWHSRTFLKGSSWILNRMTKERDEREIIEQRKKERIQRLDHLYDPLTKAIEALEMLQALDYDHDLNDYYQEALESLRRALDEGEA